MYSNTKKNSNNNQLLCKPLDGATGRWKRLADDPKPDLLSAFLKGVILPVGFLIELIETAKKINKQF